jgi:inner membrane protein
MIENIHQKSNDMTTETNNAVIMPQAEQKKPAMQDRPKMNRSDRMLLKIILIGLLSIVLLIPQQLILHLVNERYNTSREAEAEVEQMWSSSQQVIGPVVHIPARDNQSLDVYLLPEEFNVKGDLKTENRRRGSFDVTVYSADLQMDGSFLIPSLSDYSEAKYRLDKAEVMISLSDFRGLTENVVFRLNGQDYAMKSDKDGQLGSVLCCRIPLSELQGDKPVPYSVRMPLKGSESIMFLPIGNSTSVQFASNCGTPSFQGNFLPVERTVSDTGFTATWKVLALNRDFAQSVTKWCRYCDESAHAVDKDDNEFGVIMRVPVMQYQQTTRCVKYAYLFIFLTFATVFFVEYRRQTPIHPVQYLLIGVALLVFYTLLLSFSEHIPFLWSYLIATLMTITLITVYLAGILKIRKTALMVGGLLLTLYIFIYVLLQLETYALLFGSLGIFVILAVLMYASQKVKWYKVN